MLYRLNIFKLVFQPIYFLWCNNSQWILDTKSVDTEGKQDISAMFSIKFTGLVIISMIIFPKFLACASLKNYGKTHGNFPRIP